MVVAKTANTHALIKSRPLTVRHFAKQLRHIIEITFLPYSGVIVYSRYGAKAFDKERF